MKENVANLRVASRMFHRESFALYEMGRGQSLRVASRMFHRESFALYEMGRGRSLRVASRMFHRESFGLCELRNGISVEELRDCSKQSFVNEMKVEGGRLA